MTPYQRIALAVVLLGILAALVDWRALIGRLPRLTRTKFVQPTCEEMFVNPNPDPAEQAQLKHDTDMTWTQWLSRRVATLDPADFDADGCVHDHVLVRLRLEWQAAVKS